MRITEYSSYATSRAEAAEAAEEAAMEAAMGHSILEVASTGA